MVEETKKELCSDGETSGEGNQGMKKLQEGGDYRLIWMPQ